jgi:hypothetical protein
MTNKEKSLAVLLLVVGVSLTRADEDLARDVVPIMPVAQGRIFDTRYYGGPGGNPLVLSPDGKYAVGSSGGNQLMVYELGKTPTNRPGRTLQTDNPNFYRPALAFTSDGKTLVGMSNNYPDLNLRFWDIASGKETRQIDNDQPFNSLAISPDGKLLALGTNQRIEIWDAATSDDVRTLPGPQNTYYQVLTFSRDGRMLAGATNQAIQVWEMATGQERAVLRLSTANPQLNANLIYQGGTTGTGLITLAFSADGSILAAAGNDSSVHLWNLRTGQELPPLVGHQGQVTALIFTADGRRLLSLDTGGMKLEWDARRLAAAGTGKLRAPDDSEMNDLWESLADADPFQTYRTARLLATDPQRALAFLQGRLQPVPAGNTQQIAQLVADLQNPSGAVRRKAMAGLRQHGEPALGALLKMAQNNQGFNQNVSMMINKLDSVHHTPDRQRSVKAVQVLEQIGNAEAKQLLEKLAKGAAGARLTTAAQASLDRLKDRPVASDHAAEPRLLWDDLAGSDAKKAFRAIIDLTSQADKSLPWLRAHVKPVAPPETKQLDDLVAALDGANFAMRQKAMNELDKLGEAAASTLQKAVTTPISLEAKRRIEQLLVKLERQNLSSSQLQQLRAVEVLEQIGSSPARQLLQELAQGAPAVRLTRHAADALSRLENRKVR